MTTEMKLVIKGMAVRPALLFYVELPKADWHRFKDGTFGCREANVFGAVGLDPETGKPTIVFRYRYCYTDDPGDHRDHFENVRLEPAAGLDLDQVVENFTTGVLPMLARPHHVPVPPGQLIIVIIPPDAGPDEIRELTKMLPMFHTTEIPAHMQGGPKGEA